MQPEDDSVWRWCSALIPLWILFTLMAVCAQTVRTAGQKQLSLSLDSVTVTYARYLYGAPFVLAYYALLWNRAEILPDPGASFWILCSLGAGAQILATILMVQLFRRRNFAVGITYVRSEAFLTAFLGTLFFGEVLSFNAWVAILVSVAGVLVMNAARNDTHGSGIIAWMSSPSAIIGLSSGLLFAITSLFIRTAGLSLGLDDLIFSGATTLVAIVSIQTVSMTLWFAVKNRAAVMALLGQWKLGIFVGATSAIGSAGWFTAMTLERASYAKALGQVELILALGVSAIFFREKILRLEVAGMVLMIVGILGLLLA